MLPILECVTPVIALYEQFIAYISCTRVSFTSDSLNGKYSTYVVDLHDLDGQSESLSQNGNAGLSVSLISNVVQSLAVIARGV